ncbi:MAG: hypothetical protein V5A14_03450 [Desulfohalobiaceae bacterium]
MSEANALSPVKPVGMEIVYYYPCPHCERKVPLIAPTQPSRVQCDACRGQFPVVPADEKTVSFLKTIMDSGRAGIDSSFL